MQPPVNLCLTITFGGPARKSSSAPIGMRPQPCKFAQATYADDTACRALASRRGSRKALGFNVLIEFGNSVCSLRFQPLIWRDLESNIAGNLLQEDANANWIRRKSICRFPEERALSFSCSRLSAVVPPALRGRCTSK